jgi:hypothetical protein
MGTLSHIGMHVILPLWNLCVSHSLGCQVVAWVKGMYAFATRRKILGIEMEGMRIMDEMAIYLYVKILPP